ncbi:porin [Herbaspirillum lusitanum]|uniref:Porin n=1 Tax=Herbaspirillum lusitanum TaxID=213312 RepID=A0ABW9AEY7_9BURK
MKRKVIAFALIGATSAYAMADDEDAVKSVGGGSSSVTIYGVADMGITREGGGPGGTVYRMTSGGMSGSRIGFRGIEDLGGGLAAIFGMEAGVYMDTGASAQGGVLFGRQSYVGLTGKGGELTMGRLYSFMDKHLARVDPFVTNSPAQMDNLLVKGYTVRAENGVKYVTPSMNGVKVGVMTGLGEVAGDFSAKRYLGGVLSYENGPLYVGVAHQNLNTLSATNVKGKNNKTLFGGSYDFKVVRMHLGYAINKTTEGAATTEDTRDYALGASVPVFGTDHVLADVVFRKDRSSTSNNARMYGVGYLHALSKRTSLYTVYARVSNTNKAAYTIAPSAAGGAGTNALMLGVRHIF